MNDFFPHALSEAFSEAGSEAQHDQPTPPTSGGAVDFQLEPWPVQKGEVCSTPPRFDGQLSRNGQEIAICYLLRGGIERLVMASPSTNPERRDDLWRTTCLEFFLALPGHEPYWEFNLSPEGHWNVYRFGGYRQGMVLEAAYGKLPFQVQRHPHSLQLSLQCPLPPAIGPDQPIEVGICAVLEAGSNLPTYWALTHPGTEPDFHRREGFTIRL